MATKRQVGLKDFHVCKLVSDTPGVGATYEAPVRIPGIISATMSTERATENYYSDDMVEETFSSFNSITLEVEVSNLSQAERALLLGQTVVKGVSTCGRVVCLLSNTEELSGGNVIEPLSLLSELSILMRYNNLTSAFIT